MNSDLRVRALNARAVMVPLKRPPRAASGEIPQAPLVLIDVDAGDGVTGSAYLFAFSRAMLKPLVACVDALGAMAADEPLAPYAIEHKLRRGLTLLDTPGLVGLALAGIDMCVWDALAKSLGAPLARLLGGASTPIRAYNSCGLWIKDPTELADEAEELLAEGGFSALKLRLGRPDFADDLRAVRAVKQRVGDAADVMSDFNQSLSLNEALRRCRALDGEGLYWIEEPIRHDDYAGYAEINRAIATPIQTGENLLGAPEMQKAIAAGAANFYMPDVQRIGGVSGWIRAASLAQAHGLEMSSHLFPEISAHLLAATPTAHWLEYVDWANAVLQYPADVNNGFVAVPERPGNGIAWDEDAVARYRA